MLPLILLLGALIRLSGLVWGQSYFYFGQGDGVEALRVAVDMYESELVPLFAQVRERYPSTYLKGYIALGGRETLHGLPLDIVARSTPDAPAETILQQAVAYLSDQIGRAHV